MSLTKISNQDLVKDYFDCQTEVAICRAALNAGQSSATRELEGRKRKSEHYMHAIAKELDERGALELILT